MNHIDLNVIQTIAGYRFPVIIVVPNRTVWRVARLVYTMGNREPVKTDDILLDKNAYTNWKSYRVGVDRVGENIYISEVEK